MKRFNKLVATLLCALMVFTSFNLNVFAENTSDELAIYSGSSIVSEIVLPSDEKVELQTSYDENSKYQWQLATDSNKTSWVNIYDQRGYSINLSYAMVSSLLDSSATTYVRVIKDEVVSQPVKVTVVQSNKQSGEVVDSAASAFRMLKSTNKINGATYNAEQPLADEQYNSYNIVVNYVYEDGSTAFDSYAANIEENGSFETTVTFPTIVGYLPYDFEDNQINELHIDIKEVTRDITYTITYKPAEVKYTVIHMLQNALDDNYVEYETEDKLGLTNSVVPECKKSYEGFTALLYEKVNIAADGSTTVTIYYDRNYYLLNFDLDGGYGVEPIYARYGTKINDVGTPIKAGYVFAGWELAGVDGAKPTETQKAQYDINDGKQIAIPQANLSYKALWTTQDTTYTMVFWRENADDDNYSYWGYMTMNSMSGSIVSGADRIREVAGIEDEAYFTYDDTLTDKNVVVEGDGSTVVNVYYKRNKYTLTFVADSLTCTKTEHTHSNDCCKYGGTSLLHWRHSDDCCTERLKAHSHGDSCYEKATVKIVERKYDANITDIWPIVDDNGVTYDGNSWQSSVTSDNYTFLEKMPNQDITLTDLGKSGYEYKWYYYLEVLPGQDTTGLITREDDGKTYYLYFTSSAYASSLRLTYEEDYFPITGFTQRDSDVPSFRNRIAYLYYTRNSHELTFSNYGDILEDKTETVLYGSSLADKNFIPDYPDTLEPNAYEFKGWYTTPQCFAGTEFNFTSQTTPDGDLLLYAKWEPVTHTVKFYLDRKTYENGGDTLTSHPDMSVKHNGLINGVDIPENGNYSFIGWFYLDNGVEKAFDFSNMPVTKDMEVYGKWSSNVLVEYKIKYVIYIDKEKDLFVEIADDTDGSALAGTSKTFEAKTGAELYNGYQKGYYPKTGSHNMTMNIDGENVYIFEYIALPDVEYTVKYIDKATGKEMAGVDPNPKIVTTKDAVVTEVFVPITGYMPDAYQKRLVLSANKEENVIIFYYTADTENAYYVITHWVQNIEGDGYSEYRSIQAPGKIGSTISEEPLTIKGFTYKEDKSNASGKITAAGLELNLRYDRNTYPLTAQYLEYNTNTPLADPYTTPDLYRVGKQVSATAKDIKGYKLVGEQTRVKTISEPGSSNVITFYYIEEEVTISYVAIEAGYGTVSVSQEIVKANTGTASGSTPTAKPRYRFVGWYTDKECTKPVDTSWIDPNNKLVPQKVDGLNVSATYYAKFVENLGDLTIKKNGCSNIDENQTFLFRLKGLDEGVNDHIDMVVTIHGNGSVTIKDLFVGNYSVTELTDWSFRYTPDAVTKNVNVTTTGLELTFNNNRSLLWWLDGSNYKVNLFNQGN